MAVKKLQYLEQKEAERKAGMIPSSTIPPTTGAPGRKRIIESC